MDKFVHNLDKEHRSRKGFALLLTLSILSIVIALSTVLVNYISTTNKNMIDTKALIEGDILYSDIKQILLSVQKDKETIYKMLYETPLPFSLDDDRFSFILKCKPLANGVNINWLIYNTSAMQSRVDMVHQVLDVIFQKYDIQNPNYLEEMLREYMYISETKHKEILSKNEFENIILKYMFSEDDKSVEHIPWDKYFVFNHVNKQANNNKIDANYMSVELISALFGIDIDSLREEWVEGSSDLSQLLGNNGIALDKKIYSINFYPYSKCEVSYSYMDRRFKFSFNDIKGEVKDFEFYGKQ